MDFKEWLLLEKFQDYGSAMCIRCKRMLMVLKVVENNNHIYPIGQLWECNCQESKMWTNSIRNENRLLAFLDGKEKQYTNGFCNDLFCGHCFHNLYPMRNAGFKLWNHSDLMATAYGCQHCKKETIAIDMHQELKENETQPILEWYRRQRKQWEYLVEYSENRCPDCESKKKGQWRTGRCDLCRGLGRIDMQHILKNPMLNAEEYMNLKHGQICPNCQGTGSPVCCRCKGTGVDLYNQ